MLTHLYYVHFTVFDFAINYIVEYKYNDNVVEDANTVRMLKIRLLTSL